MRRLTARLRWQLVAVGALNTRPVYFREWAALIELQDDARSRLI
jgi:hypothetical protein